LIDGTGRDAAPVVQREGQIGEIAHGAREAVEPPDHKRVAIAERRQRVFLRAMRRTVTNVTSLPQRFRLLS